MIDLDELLDAYRTARRDLLAQRVAAGHWVGELSTSALSTATAVSALTIFARETEDVAQRDACRRLAAAAVDWLAAGQNADGGWGDTDKSLSNISTTILVQAAFHLADVAEQHAAALRRAGQYVDAQGGLPALRRRYGKDKTFVVPILTNAALAGLVPWREVAPLPFELASLPHGLFRFLRLPVVSYAIPALVAIGQARYFHRRPLNPITRLIRRLAIGRSLAAIEPMQPASGGFLEAVPLTSFVIMGLASTGRAEHAVVRRGVEFLHDSARADGSWPIDTNLATWTTILAICALAGDDDQSETRRCLPWLLSCQHRRPHPLSHAAPGGWGWTDLSGSVPDVDDTSGALLALSTLRGSVSEAERRRIDAAVTDGVTWLLNIQNADGGWPTFCRGWGTLPFDRSGADLTAHAIRALWVWRDSTGGRGVDGAIRRGQQYLAAKQRVDGSWIPLWFGNQHHGGEENPVYGTARVLLAYRDLGQIESQAPRRGLKWLATNQGPDGGWGGPANDGSSGSQTGESNIEETALAVESLLAGHQDPSLRPAIRAGLRFLAARVRQGRGGETAPIGFYFAKLWYYERLYPLTFVVAALGEALRRLYPATEPNATLPPLGNIDTAG